MDGSRRRAQLILIAGVLFALLAGGATFLIAQGSQNQAPPPLPTKPVVVAAREIPAKTTLTAADLTVAKINVDAAPPAAPETIDALVGKITLVPVSLREPMLPSKYAAPGALAFTVFPADQIGANGAPNPGSPNYRAMSLTVPDANAAGGTIQAGDLVDVLYVLNFDPVKYLQKPDVLKNGGDFSAKIVLERVPILERALQIYTIRVDAETAERVGYLQSAGGALSLLLRAPKDDRAVNSTGQTFTPIQQQFKIKIPEKIAP